MSGLILADSVEPVAQISGGLAEPLTFLAVDELLLLLRVDLGERDGQTLNVEVVPVLHRYRMSQSTNAREGFPMLVFFFFSCLNSAVCMLSVGFTSLWRWPCFIPLVVCSCLLSPGKRCAVSALEASSRKSNFLIA